MWVTAKLFSAHDSHASMDLTRFGRRNTRDFMGAHLISHLFFGGFCKVKA